MAENGRCPSCHDAVLENDWFCPSCGAPVTPASVATWVLRTVQLPPSSAVESQTDAGRWVDPADDFIPLQLPESTSRRRHGRRWTKIGAIVGIVLVILIGLLFIAESLFSNGGDADDDPSYGSAAGFAAGAVIARNFDPARSIAMEATATMEDRPSVHGATPVHEGGDPPAFLDVDAAVSVSPSSAAVANSGDGTGGVVVAAERRSALETPVVVPESRSPLEP